MESAPQREKPAWKCFSPMIEHRHKILTIFHQYFRCLFGFYASGEQRHISL